MKAVISVIGKDCVGILAKVSGICAAHSVNVVDVTQSVLKDVFVMVMLGEIDCMDCSMAQLSDELSALGKTLGLDIRVMHEDIFNSMHRI